MIGTIWRAISWIVKIATFVEEHCGFRQGQETVSKSDGDVHQILSLCRKYHAGRFPELRGADTNVHGDIQHFALDDAA
jgi:hypothetical protein